AGGAPRPHEALLLVDAERLGVHADELGGDGDHVAGAGALVHQPPAFCSSSSRSRCLRDTFLGTSIRMRASTSPRPPPFTCGTPRPLMRSSFPSSVPAGTFSDTGPSGVGASTVPPSAAVENGTGTATTRSSPRRS